MRVFTPDAADVARPGRVRSASRSSSSPWPCPQPPWCSSPPARIELPHLRSSCRCRLRRHRRPCRHRTGSSDWQIPVGRSCGTAAATPSPPSPTATIGSSPAGSARTVRQPAIWEVGRCSTTAVTTPTDSGPRAGSERVRHEIGAEPWFPASPRHSRLSAVHPLQPGGAHSSRRTRSMAATTTAGRYRVANRARSHATLSRVSGLSRK
jgi:hypothetical protein